MRYLLLAGPLGVVLAAPAYGKAVDDWEIYGYGQVDVIADTKRVDPAWEDAFRPSKIPTVPGTFGSDGQTSVSVKQSRLGVKASGEAGGQPFEAKFEFDMFGVGDDAGKTAFRLRHAYGRWGPVLGGQTNSLFMDIDVFPNVIDYWGPPGMVFLRNPQLRVYIVDKKEFSAAVAIEKPSNDIDTGLIRNFDPNLGANIRNDEKLPDFTAAVRYNGDWGHVQLSGILRRVGYDTAGTPDNEPKGSKLGWGLNLGGSFTVKPATLRASVVYGQGIASYMNDGGMDLAPRALTNPVPAQPIAPTPLPQGEAKAVPLLGISAYVDLAWSKTLSSSVGYSFDKVDNTNFQAPEAFHRGEYASGNLLWTPIPRIMVGGEVMWGRRTDNDGARGDDVRFQMSFKVSFSSKDFGD
jgi:hypothetical protein